MLLSRPYHDFHGLSISQDLIEDPQNQNPAFGPNYGPYDSLISEMLSCSPMPCTPVDTVPRTAQIVKAVCAVATGGAVMLVQ